MTRLFMLLALACQLQALSLIATVQSTNTGTDYARITIAPPLPGDLVVCALTSSLTLSLAPDGWSVLDTNFAVIHMWVYTHVYALGDANFLEWDFSGGPGDSSLACNTVRGQATRFADGHGINAGFGVSSLATLSETPTRVGDLALSYAIPIASAETVSSVSGGWAQDGALAGAVVPAHRTALTTDTVTGIGNTFGFTGSTTAMSAIVLILPFSPVPVVSQYKQVHSAVNPTATVTFDTAPAVGDLLICGGANSTGTISTGAGWTILDTQNTGGGLLVTWSHIVSASDTNAYVFTIFPPFFDAEIGCYDVSAPAGFLVVDQHAISVWATATTATTPSVTPGTTDDLALAFNAHTVTVSVPGVSAGWGVDTSGASNRLWSASKVLASTASVTNTFTTASGNQTAGIVLVAKTSTSSVSGVLQTPDAVNFKGSVTIQLTKPTLTNTCVTPQQVVSYFTATASVVNGQLTPQRLYPSACLSLGVASAAKLTPLTGMGGGALSTITGSASGSLTVVAGTSPAASAAIARIGLTVPDPVTCFMQPANANAVAANATAKVTTVTRRQATQIGRYLTLSSGLTALTPGQTYIWSFSCVVPYAVGIYDAGNNLIYSAQWVIPNIGGVDVSAVDLTQIGALR